MALVTNEIQEFYKTDVKVYLYGSQATELAIDGSDIDLAVIDGTDMPLLHTYLS